MKVYHELEPFYNTDSTILILGSMPSIKSRDLKFYYAHPQNRFWKVLSFVYGEQTPISIKEKKDFLVRKHIALWDVIASCDINGSSDNSIKNIEVNDIACILKKTNITKIYTTGKKSYELYQKYCFPITKMNATYLPSTSSANIANFSEEDLQKAYKIVKI